MSTDKMINASLSRNIFKFKKPAKNMFWAWIAYQTVKGTLTTSLIWVPLIYAYFH